MAKIDAELECVRMTRHPDSVTIQLAFQNKLAVPMTVENEAFFGWPTLADQIAWMKRQARALLEIYGDARDGLVLSDQEVLQRANAA